MLLRLHRRTNHVCGCLHRPLLSKYDFSLIMTAIDVKPTVYEHGNMVIKKGRHPVVENAMNNQSYVPSDTVKTSNCQSRSYLPIDDLPFTVF